VAESWRGPVEGGSSIPSACSARSSHWRASSSFRCLPAGVRADAARAWHFSAFARYRSDREDIGTLTQRTADFAAGT
jgi:hypothetical protein